MKRQAILGIALTSLILLGSNLSIQAAGEGKEVQQTTCLLTGRPIDRDIYADHEGKRVYFCCAGCREKFESDPATYVNQLESQGIALEEVGAAQAKCPVMGGAIDKNAYTDYDGKRIYFCCPGCEKTFLTDPEAYIRKMESQGIRLESAPVAQALCPVMDMEIDSQFFVDHEGQRIYFCCAPCVTKFNQDPERYLRKLQEQGVTLERVPVDETD